MRVRFNMLKGDMLTPDERYRDYIYKHINGVSKVYNKILRPILVQEGVPNSKLMLIDLHIKDHDKSKFTNEEWGPYRNYFYDHDKYPRSSEAFNYAWNHHQNSNPHHWQFWCLINDVDEPQVQPLDMPLEYIIEMLSDWHAAGSFYGNSAYDWYVKQKDKMILSDKTRETVEKYIVYLKDKIEL